MLRWVGLIFLMSTHLALAAPGERHRVEKIETAILPWAAPIAGERLANSLKDIRSVLSKFKPRDLEYTDLEVDPEPGNKALLRFDAHLFGKRLPFRGESSTESVATLCSGGNGSTPLGHRVVMLLSDSHPWIAGNFSQVQADLCIEPVGA